MLAMRAGGRGKSRANQTSALHGKSNLPACMIACRSLESLSETLVIDDFAKDGSDFDIA